MGAVWFGVLKHMPPMTLLNVTVLPFLPGDVLKVVAAAGIAVGAARWRRS
jgi:biotin transport system substrate-specific component